MDCCVEDEKGNSYVKGHDVIYNGDENVTLKNMDTLNGQPFHRVRRDINKVNLVLKVVHTLGFEDHYKTFIYKNHQTLSGLNFVT